MNEGKVPIPEGLPPLENRTQTIIDPCVGRYYRADCRSGDGGFLLRDETHGTLTSLHLRTGIAKETFAPVYASEIVPEYGLWLNITHDHYTGIDVEENDTFEKAVGIYKSRPTDIVGWGNTIALVIMGNDPH